MSRDAQNKKWIWRGLLAALALTACETRATEGWATAAFQALPAFAEKCAKMGGRFEQHPRPNCGHCLLDHEFRCVMPEPKP